MSLPTLYNLTDDFRKLMDADEDEVVSALIEISAGEIEKKCEGYCQFLAEVESRIEAFKAEETRIAGIRRAMENKVKLANDRMKESLLNAGIDKVSAGTFKISVSLTAGTLVIDDEKAIPARYITVIHEQHVPDKTAIKNAIKAGETCDYAHIEAGFSLRIK